MKYLILIFFVLLVFSCSTNQKPEVNQTSNLDTYIDVPFSQEYHDGYTIDSKISESNDVRAIQPDNNNNIWIATRHGVYMKKSGTRDWELMIIGTNQGPAYDIEMEEDGTVWIATWNGVYTGNSGKIVKMDDPTPPLAKIAVASEGIYALGPFGIWLYQDNSWQKKDYSTARSIRAAISDNNGGLWI